MNRYLITLRGQVDVDELNLASPHFMTLIQASALETTISICTDQSGCLGLLRHLHNLGLDIRSMNDLAESLTITERKDQ